MDRTHTHRHATHTHRGQRADSSCSLVCEFVTFVRDVCACRSCMTFVRDVYAWRLCVSGLRDHEVGVGRVLVEAHARQELRRPVFKPFRFVSVQQHRDLTGIVSHPAATAHAFRTSPRAGCVARAELSTEANSECKFHERKMMSSYQTHPADCASIVPACQSQRTTRVFAPSTAPPAGPSPPTDTSWFPACCRHNDSHHKATAAHQHTMRL